MREQEEDVWVCGKHIQIWGFLLTKMEFLWCFWRDGTFSVQENEFLSWEICQFVDHVLNHKLNKWSVKQVDQHKYGIKLLKMWKFVQKKVNLTLQPDLIRYLYLLLYHFITLLYIFLYFVNWIYTKAQIVLHCKYKPTKLS